MCVMACRATMTQKQALQSNAIVDLFGRKSMLARPDCSLVQEGQNSYRELPMEVLSSQRAACIAALYKRLLQPSCICPVNMERHLLNLCCKKFDSAAASSPMGTACSSSLKRCGHNCHVKQKLASSQYLHIGVQHYALTS